MSYFVIFLLYVIALNSFPKREPRGPDTRSPFWPTLLVMAGCLLFAVVLWVSPIHGSDVP